ncbi:hypothetical protein DL765_010261 [Monosporascus sp. GIB2]|nr:hypothetical protein DL765_010261 [Monosporascus sp. GIB2]
MASEEAPIRPSQPSEAAPALRLPGPGLPVDSGLEDMALPSALVSQWGGLEYWASQGVTLREQLMAAFSDIADKPERERKVFDQAIVAKWRAESDVELEHLDGDVLPSQKVFDFCIQEFRDKAAIYKDTGVVDILDGELTIGVKVLEDVPDRLKDWHPRSDNLVLDLLHPSLFPVAYGLTRYLPDEKVPLDRCLEYIGRDTSVDSIKAARSGSNGPFEWGSFQWLPTDVKLTGAGAELQGYVNNPHPEKHRALYKILENVVGATVPVWEETMSGFNERRRIKIANSGGEGWTYPKGLRYRIPGPGGRPGRVEDGGWGDRDNFRWDYEFDDWTREHRILISREPREYTPQPELRDPEKRVDFKSKHPEGLQAIFKLANIHLTPEKPEYGGGSWDVEGGFNEMICASAIYYYDQEDVTDSHLAFGQALDHEEITMIPKQAEHQALEVYLGVQQDGPADPEPAPRADARGAAACVPELSAAPGAAVLSTG